MPTIQIDLQNVPVGWTVGPDGELTINAFNGALVVRLLSDQASTDPVKDFLNSLVQDAVFSSNSGINGHVFRSFRMTLARGLGEKELGPRPLRKSRWDSNGASSWDFRAWNLMEKEWKQVTVRDILRVNLSDFQHCGPRIKKLCQTWLAEHNKKLGTQFQFGHNY